jgi:hypothetical protein
MGQAAARLPKPLTVRPFHRLTVRPPSYRPFALSPYRPIALL